MSFEQRLLGLMIFVVITFCIDFYLVKVLKIGSPRKKTFDKGRKKFFVVSEVAVLIGFAVITLVLATNFPLSTSVTSLPLFLYFALLFLIRGIEEFVHNKGAKSYYHDWISSFCFVCMFTFLFLTR